MIRRVLHQTVQHVIEVVMRALLARNLLHQPRRGKARHGFDQLVVRPPHMFERAPPRRVAGIRDGRKIRVAGKLHDDARHAPPASAIPGRDVQDQFPNAVRIFNQLRRGLRCRDIVQNFEERIPMPRLAVKGAS